MGVAQPMICFLRFIFIDCAVREVDDLLRMAEFQHGAGTVRYEPSSHAFRY